MSQVSVKSDLDNKLLEGIENKLKKTIEETRVELDNMILQDNASLLIQIRINN